MLQQQSHDATCSTQWAIMSQSCLSTKRGFSIALSAFLLLGCGLPFFGQSDETTETQRTSEAISPLTSLPPRVRAPQLKQLAKDGSRTEKNQARYLLAADLIQQQQGEVALEYLQGLEKKYPLLAGEVMVLQAKAHADQPEKAKEIWQDILKEHPDTPAAAEALYALGKNDSEFWDQALEQFPSHPRAIDIAVDHLKTINPVNVDFRLLIAKYGHWHPDYGRYLKRLTTEFRGRLKPKDWQTVAFGYWDRQVYKEAGLAYAKAPPSSLTAFRAARGLQLGGEKDDAISTYKEMIAQYPEAKETATALLKLAQLQENPAELDRALKLAKTNNQIHRAGQIVLAKWQLLKKQQSAAAPAVQEQLLKDYGKTEAAAEFRWEAAQAAAKAYNPETARKWALQLQTQNVESELAAKATFWAGKWGEQPQATQTAAQELWKNHPTSYYAWRAASQAGWDVGTFDTVRYVQPNVTPPGSRLPLPAGSVALQELYQLGQAQTAYDRWQWEFKNREQRSFEEQLTDGLLRIEVGDYLRGMFMLLNLYYRAQEEPEQRALYQKWRQDPRFWQALYPLVYFQETSKWSKERNLNPLLVLGLIRQESRFQTEIRSVAGAVGLMQVLPSTGEETSRRIGLEDYQLTDVDNNINLGTAYFDFVHQIYENNSALAIASYNAGPGSVEKWLRESPNKDLDTFIEDIPFPETNYYVKVVLENYWNYLRLYNPAITKQLKTEAGGS